MHDLDMGLDAIERVLKKVKYEGMHHFGHSCKYIEYCKVRWRILIINVCYRQEEFGEYEWNTSLIIISVLSFTLKCYKFV